MSVDGSIPKPSGAFDRKPREGTSLPQNEEAVAPKENFKDPFEAHSDAVSESMMKQKRSDPLKGMSEADRAADAINSNAGGTNVQSDLDDLETVSEDELEIAEQMVFRGYAEFDASMPNIPKVKFTICSTSAEEMAVIDDVIFGLLKEHEQDDGSVDLPQNYVQGMRNALYIALSYRGMNRKELMDDSSCHLNTIKQAIIKVSELNMMGEVKKAKEIKEILKKALVKRATHINRLAHPVIDFLSSEKQNFDIKMLKIMSIKRLLPKS